MDEKKQGVISYAGLDVQTLLAGARLMFAGDGSEGESRLMSVMPLFPAELILSMPFAGVAQPGQNVAPGGFSIDPAEYHCRLHSRMPRLYAGDNLLRNTDGEGQFHGRGVVTVDEVWTTCFPQYQPYAGDRLAIYPLGGGAQCAAVPESLYPRAAGFLRQAETALGITGRCHDYAHYVYARIRSGQSFDAELFETEYLTDRELAPVTITQRDLGRLMQDLTMLRSVREGSEDGGLYTESAKRAEHIRQYVPGLYACDVFEEIPQSRYTAKLVQPMWEDGFISDWWMPWQDAQAYLNRERGALDMSALCDGYQIAPVYDPATRGGRYPSRLRMVSVRDKELKLRLGDTLNNPAYGSGMSPAGSISKLVYLPDSRELLRQGRLAAEEAVIFCEKTAVPPEAYREMTALASLQEGKGRLVDALYRRESVLSEVRELSPDYAQLRQTMNGPVERLERTLPRREKASLSGYDADLDYLRRMGMEREWKPMPNKQKTFRFAPDALRQVSIESGFAMRTACLRCDWDDLRLAGDADEAVAGCAGNGAADAGGGVAAAGVAGAGVAGAGVAGAGFAGAGVTGFADAGVAADVFGAAAFVEPEDILLSAMAWEKETALWENAADPCYLTTEAGGQYPTDEAAAAGAPVPMPGQKPAAAEPAKEEKEPAKPKPKKGGKGRKKTAAQAAARPSKPGNDRKFTEEELVERQTHLTLPEGGAAEQTDAEAAETAAEFAADSTVGTVGGKDADQAGEPIGGSAADRAGEAAVEAISGKAARKNGGAAEAVAETAADSTAGNVGGKVDNQAGEPVSGKAVDQAAGSVAEAISGKAARKASEAAEAIADSAADSTAGNVGGKAADQAGEPIGGSAADQAAGSVAEAISGKAARKSGGAAEADAESAETAAEFAADSTAGTVGGKADNQAGEPISGKAADQTAEPVAEAISGKAADQTGAPVSGKAGDQTAEPAGNAAESADESIADPVPGSAPDPAAQEAADQPAEKPGKGKKGKKKQPVMPEGQLSFLTGDLI